MEFRAYLEANGFDTSRMGLLSEEEIKSLEEKNAADKAYYSSSDPVETGSATKEPL